MKKGCPARPVAERFWEKVIKTDSCYIWNSIKSRNGYGRFSICNKQYGAHRISYELANGPIPEGLHIDHLCRNTLCVNPQHLEAVTKRENTLRGFNPAAENARKTHCINGHEFNQENTYVVPKTGKRACIICRAATEKRRAERRKLAKQTKRSAKRVTQ